MREDAESIKEQQLCLQQASCGCGCGCGYVCGCVLVWCVAVVVGVVCGGVVVVVVVVVVVGVGVGVCGLWCVVCGVWLWLWRVAVWCVCPNNVCVCVCVCVWCVCGVCVVVMMVIFLGGGGLDACLRPCPCVLRLHAVPYRDRRDEHGDANGRSVTCPFKGDLPLLAKDSLEKEFHIVLRGVRYSPSFEDTLISVDQLWYSSSIDTRFRDMRHLLCTKSKSNGLVLTLPFGRHRGLYMWDVAVAKVAPAAAEARGHSHSLGHGLKSGIHAAGAHSHVRTLPADDVAAISHW